MHRRLSRVVFALAVVCTALFAHVAIDLAGDYLLARDAYDDVAHHSRESIFMLAVVLALTALWRTLAAARAEMDGSRGSLRVLLRGAVPRSWVRFVACVALAATPALLAMAGLDAIVDGRRIDDLGDFPDLLGGSLPLGIGCVVASAIAVATCVWGIVRVLAGLEGAILRLVAALVERTRDGDAHARLGTGDRAYVPTLASVMAVGIGLRAPPIPA